MATITEIPAVGTANQVVGKVVILYGSVKAVSPDGAERLLVPNSPIFANDHIVTESDGNVSIMFDGTPPTQMDLGRMSNVVIDEDVYAGMAPSVVSDVAAEAEQIQKALMAGDQPIDLAAPAAGGDTGAGGAHPLFVLNATGAEVTPTSGAETTGVTFGVPGTLDAVFAQPALVSPVVSIGTDIHVGTGPDIHAGSAIEGSPVTFGVYQDVVSNHDTTVTVQVVGAPGDTATPGADFTPITTLNVIIPAGQLGATFNVNTLPDQLQEGPETFTAHIVSAANPNGAVTVGIADAVGTILDAYTPPVISIGSGGGIAGGSATEGSPVTFTIHQDVVSDHDTTVTVQVVGAPTDTATAGLDYTTITSHDVIIHAGLTSATFDVSTLTDQLQEGPETFTAHIVSAANANGAVTVGTADAIGTIVDAYTPPVISIDGGITGGSATEGNPVTFTIHQSTVSDHDTTVTVQVVGASGDTATPTLDYTTITTLDVVIHAGQTSATFNVNTLTDQLQEGPETFTAHIVSAANANGAVTVGTADAIGTILDANTPPFDTTASVNESAMDTIQSSHDLAPSNVTGTNPTSPDETATGTLHLQDGWTAVASSGTTSYGTYEIHQDGTFIYTLTDAPHVSGDSTTDAITYSITNGSVTQSDNTLTMTIVDDAPLFTQIDNAVIANESSTTAGILVGTHDIVFGADGELSIDLAPLTSLPGLNYSDPIHHLDGSTTITAGASLLDSSVTSGFFELTIKPDGTYDFNLLDARPTVTTAPTTFVNATGGQAVTDFTLDGVTFSAVDSNHDGKITLSTEGVKGTSSGLGIGNGNADPGDQFSVTFGNDSSGHQIAVDVLTFYGKVEGAGSFTVSWNTDTGEHGSSTLSSNGVLSIDPLNDFHSIVFTVDDGKAKVDSFAYSERLLPGDETLHFNISAVDGDGDHTGLQTLNVTLLGLHPEAGYTITGSSGPDALIGTSANDTLHGGAGSDTFMATHGHDHITDYTNTTTPVLEHDTVDISNLVANATRANLSVTNDGGKAQLHISDAAHTEVGSITFDNISSAAAPDLDSLLGAVDVKDGTNHIT